MKTARIMEFRDLLSLVLVTTIILSAATVAQVNVTTWHNDNWRTGQNTSETILTPTNLGTSPFGLLCQLPVNGQVYAQPLVVHNSDGSMSAYVVTMQDMFYVFNVPANWDNSSSNRACSSITQPTGSPVNLISGTSGPYPADCRWIGPGSGSCGSVINPDAGALGTPVIQASTASTLYVVTESQDEPCCSEPGNWYHYLHAIDINPHDSTFLKEIDCGHGPPCGPTQITTSGFVSQVQIQRPGLLYVSGVTPESDKVYVAFSMMDGTRPQPSGWIFEYEAANLGQAGYPYVYATTPGVSGGGGGIWQGGAGLAYGFDESNNPYIYFSTADGVFDLNNGTAPNTDAADTFVKIPANLSTIGTGYFQGSPSPYFTPSDQLYRGIDCSGSPLNDVDLGSAGTMLIPDGTFTSGVYAVKSDKENYLWAMDRGGTNGPGGYNTGTSSSGHTCASDPGYSCTCSNNCPNCPTTDWANGNVNGSIPPHPGNSTFSGTHSTPAFWGGNTGGSISGGGTIAGNVFFAPVQGEIYDLPVSSNCGSGNGKVVCNSYIGITSTGSGHCPVNTSGCLGYSATPSVSSNGVGSGANGIVWAISTPAGNTQKDLRLYAFNAVPSGTTLSTLYDSNAECGNNVTGNIGPAPNHPVPTVANGLVFVGESCRPGGTYNSAVCPGGGSNTSYLAIFGLHAPGTCPGP